MAVTIGVDGPVGAGFDIVLLLHIACVLLGLAAVTASGISARTLRRGLPGPPGTGVRRYFAPGVNWAGRTLYGIPIFGFVLLAASNGSYHLEDAWVLEGLAIFVVVAFVAEGLLWPA